jgi:hypothetical protein
MTGHAVEEMHISHGQWIRVDRRDREFPRGRRATVLTGRYATRTFLSMTGAADVTGVGAGSAVHCHHLAHVAFMALAGNEGLSSGRLR